MAEPKKRKIASECRKFQTRWQNEYFFMEVKGKHYETKHQTYMSYTGVNENRSSTQHGKPFSDGDFIKQCLTKVAGIMCPEKIVRRIEDLSVNVKHQLSDKACAFDFFSIACDESTDATDTAQLLIFLRGVENNFCITEELLDLSSLKTTTTGKDMFKTVSNARWDLNGTSCVELRRTGPPKEWPLWCVPRCGRVEVRLLKCIASSTKKHSVPRQSSLAM
ncbi:General transcription factor II-I repeat domain-containing protein 2 [Merluccius polli]|uniref:General transcription factor II-I repeat domain-containing protein 2 n=1 Tax=Merluccius polli TaxID=89951 RepID=A0AA47NC98_MERPO|nr:General transcription factor II-I repeat domain-containing protein 2 [Merluccius polli]